MDIYENIDTTPTINDELPRPMLIGPGIDSASTRTFMPAVLQTSTQVYNQKLYDVDMLLKQNNVSNDSFLPTDKKESSIDDVVSNEIEKESFRRLKSKENYCQDCQNIIDQSNMKPDQLGVTSSVLNNAAQNHLMSESSDTGNAVQQMFDDYLKDNTDENKSNPYIHGELASSICSRKNQPKRREFAITIGDKLVKVGNGKLIELPNNDPNMLLLYVLFAIVILFAVIMFMYMTCCKSRCCYSNTLNKYESNFA